mgnify:CR=1 FL=1
MRILVLILLFSSCLSSQNLPSYVSSNSLERWYPFDGNANNASSSSFNGVTTNAALTTDRFGSANSAYLFGNNGYIQTPTLGQISSTSLTMSCWVNPSSTQNGGWNGVVSNQQSNSSGFLFQVSSGNYPWVTVSNGSGYNNVSNGSPLGSGWIHIVQVIKPGLMELYIDGIKTDSTTFATSVIHNTSALYIGARRFGTSTYEYYSGSIDDVGIWSRALTAQEIQDLFLRQTNLEQTRTGGDLRFEGEITSYRVNPMSATSQQTAAQNRLTITVNVRFYNRLKEEDDFEKQFSFYSDFDANAQLTGGVLDAALDEILERIIQDIFNASLGNW